MRRIRTDTPAKSARLAARKVRLVPRVISQNATKTRAKCCGECSEPCRSGKTKLSVEEIHRRMFHGTKDF